MDSLFQYIPRHIVYLAVWWLQLCFAGTCVAEPLRIHLVAHSHDDAGWLKTVDQYYTGSEQQIQHAGVEYVLDTVVQCLSSGSDRTFSFGEIAFFSRWWSQQDAPTRDEVSRLVNSGQLTFVNGGWVQHDEAASHYSMMTDQTTRGHDFLLRTFNFTPTVAWQIDPFGHSSTQASLLTARAGFNAIFFARADYDDLQRRSQAGETEAVWRSAPEVYGASADVFMGNFPNHYGPPHGFNYEWGSADPPVQDDPNLEGYNVEERAEALIDAAHAYAAASRGPDVMLLMGTDFTYSNALTWYKNMDKLIAAINRGSRAHAMYSNPAKYLEAKAAYTGEWPLRAGDLFPYADSPHTYWTGFYTSRPTLKGYIYSAHHLLAVARKASALLTLHGDCGLPSQGLTNALDALDAAVALAQHHDAVTGTAKQHVTNDYARRLAAACTEVHKHTAQLLSAAIFTPHACTSCTHKSESSIANPSDLAHTSQPHNGSSKARKITESKPPRRPAPRGGAGDSDTQAPDVPASGGAAGGSTGGSARRQGAVQAAAPRDVSEGPHGGVMRATQGLPQLRPCEMSNVTMCDAAVSASRRCESFAVVLFNSVAWAREENVRVPLSRPDCNYAAVDAASQELLTAVLPITQATWCIQQMLSVYDVAPASSAGYYEAVFQASLPAIGYTTVLLIPMAAAAAPALNGTAAHMHALDTSAVSTSVSHVPLPDGVHSGHASSCAACGEVALREGGGVLARPTGAVPAVKGAPAAIENEHLSLEFDRLSGRLGSILHKESGQRIRVDLDLVYWESETAEPYGGAYIMRPTNQVPLSWSDGSSRAALDIVNSPVVSEARQSLSPWGTLTLRLWRGARTVELEWTVGSVPVRDGIGKEVALRLRSDVDSGDVWWTDANGRQMQRRRRNWRRSWPLNITEAVAGNFYPITSAATLRGPLPPMSASSALATKSNDADTASTGDSSSGGSDTGGAGNGRFGGGTSSAEAEAGPREFEVSLVTDRAQGVASLESGSMHVLLHRRLLTDDSRGVAEPLNETVCGCRDCDCPGLIARGTFQLLLAPVSAETHERLRALQTLAGEPPLPLYGHGSDIVRWLSAHVHERGDDGELVVAKGGADVAAVVAIEDVDAVAWGWGRGRVQGRDARNAANASDLWPVGASELLASNPLAKAVLKRLGDNGVIRIETSAARVPGSEPSRGSFHQLRSRSPQLHWSAFGAPLEPHTGSCSSLACAPTPQYVIPPGLALVTFARWHGALFAAERAAQAPSACAGHGPGEDFYLLRVASITDPHDQRSGANATAAALNQTVDLCKLVAWPGGTNLRIRETTLSGNRGLRAFEAAGGRKKFVAQTTPQCFKNDPLDCKEHAHEGVEEPSAIEHEFRERVCGNAEAVDVADLNCAAGSMSVCVDAMDVRSFVVGVH